MITVAYLSKDRPAFLQRSLESLSAQTLKPEKVVVVDCSDDRESVEKVVRQSTLPIELIWKPVKELSRSAGRDLGCEQATTPLVVSTECDILYPPTLLEKSLEVFTQSPRKVLAIPWYTLLDEKGNQTKIMKGRMNGFFQVFRKADFKEIGGYNPFLSGWGYEDRDFCLRMLKHGCQLEVLPLVVKHQWHPTAASKPNNDKNKKIAASSAWNGKKWIRVLS